MLSWGHYGGCSYEAYSQILQSVQDVQRLVEEIGVGGAESEKQKWELSISLV